MGDWTFFSNYGHVLVCLARDNEVRLRDVATDVGITERAAQKIVKDMQEAGYLTVTRHGRRNRYRINKRKSLRHALESHCNVGKLLSIVARPTRERPASPTPVEPTPAPVPEMKPASVVPEEVTTRYPSTAKKEPEEAEKSEKPAPGLPDTREQGSLF